MSWGGAGCLCFGALAGEKLGSRAQKVTVWAWGRSAKRAGRAAAQRRAGRSMLAAAAHARPCQKGSPFWRSISGLPWRSCWTQRAARCTSGPCQSRSRCALLAGALCALCCFAVSLQQPFTILLQEHQPCTQRLSVRYHGAALSAACCSRVHNDMRRRHVPVQTAATRCLGVQAEKGEEFVFTVRDPSACSGNVLGVSLESFIEDVQVGTVHGH